MKEQLKRLVISAATKAHAAGDLPAPDIPPADIDVPRAAAHGDFSSNMAMQMAKLQKMAPRKIAEVLLKHIADDQAILKKVEIAGPGFINFFIKPGAWLPYLRDIHEADVNYGRSGIGNQKKIQVEFVSANPTGPLHVGHGRGAAVGDAVANILSFCGYNVQREYYVNDSGRQIRTLGLSVYLRYRSFFEDTVDFPAECYQGDYIRDIAAGIKTDEGSRLMDMAENEAVAFCAGIAAGEILDGIRKDLAEFGVTFDRWYSEQSLYDAEKVDAVIEHMKADDLMYLHEGAVWFRTSRYGDEKDRVVVRENGLTTYFASDIAYHQEKFERGFDRIIDVWGADHHGYIPRMRAAVEAVGRNRDQFDVILVQLVNLLRAGEPVAMSTRSGEFVTLQEVVAEVGKDAARFIFLTRHYDSPLDFDMDVATKKSNDNPVYYVQYVHARIASILRKADLDASISKMVWDASAMAKLQEPEEIQLIKQLVNYPETVETAAALLEPHRITYYLMDLAAAFHAYYNRHRVLTEDESTTQARLYLVTAIKKLIRNGLTLLGVSAPEQM